MSHTFNSDALDPLQTVMPFGKHKDKTLREIGEEDPKYLDWLVGLDDIKPPRLRTAIARAHVHFSDAISRALDE